MDLSPLAELPQSTRCTLFKRLQEILQDRTALSYLQCAVRDMALTATGKHSLQAPLFFSFKDSTMKAKTLFFQMFVNVFFVVPPFLSQLEDLCCGETPNGAEHDELSESQRKLVSAILDGLSTDSPTENGQCDFAVYLNAAHLLVTTLDGEGELCAEEAINIFLTVLEHNRKQLFHTFILLIVLCVPFVELPDETLSLLSQSCPDFLEAIDTLVS